MATTVECTHRRVEEKLAYLQSAVENINHTIRSLHTHLRPTEIARALSGVADVNTIADKCKTLVIDYRLAVVDVLNKYYSTQQPVSREYYITLSSENILTGIHDAHADLNACYLVLSNLGTKTPPDGILDAYLDALEENLKNVNINTIIIPVVADDYETCYCGARMVIMQAISKFHCNACDAYKTIEGVHAADQSQGQTEIKQRSSGYDPNRHHRTWIEQIQAVANKDFTQTELDTIDRALVERAVVRSALTCEYMRTILKIKKMTKYNDFVPLLVKLMGGPTPPQLTFEDNRVEAVRFARAIELHSIVVPGGGNKMYYPYFIYRIYEHMFRADPYKKKILQFIHLQSYDTIMKHDKIFEKICDLANPDDELVYTPTIIG